MNNLWGDSLSGFWSAWIIIITLGTIALSVWILLANRRTDKRLTRTVTLKPPATPPMASKSMTTRCQSGGSSFSS